jgi:hypothetical protein
MLRQNPEALEVFMATGWLQYFEKLQGYNNSVALDFAMNLEGNRSMVKGLPIDFSEQEVAEVTGLPQSGIRWFGKWKTIMQTEQLFSRGGEVLQQRGHGISRILLPPPWDIVSLGIQKFLTCEGRYTILFHYYFRLLSHLEHKHLMNIPYFLYGMLRQMAAHVQKSKRPTTSVSHHGLIKLLALRSLARQWRRWDELVIVLEEGSAAKVSAQQGDLMGEQEGMHAGNSVGQGVTKSKMMMLLLILMILLIRWTLNSF